MPVRSRRFLHFTCSNGLLKLARSLPISSSVQPYLCPYSEAEETTLIWPMMICSSAINARSLTNSIMQCMLSTAMMIITMVPCVSPLRRKAYGRPSTPAPSIEMNIFAAAFRVLLSGACNEDQHKCENMLYTLLLQTHSPIKPTS